MSIDFSNLSYDLSHIDPFEAHDEAKRAYEQADRDTNEADPENVLNEILDGYWVAQGNIIVPDDWYSRRNYRAGYQWNQKYCALAKEEPRFIATAAKYAALQVIQQALKVEWLDARKALDLSDLPVGTVISFRVQVGSDTWSRSADYDTERGPITKITDTNYLVDVGHKSRRVPRDNGEGSYTRQIQVVWGADGNKIEMTRLQAERVVQDEKNRIAVEALEIVRAARFRKEQADEAHLTYIAALQDAVLAAKTAALADLMTDMAPVLERYTRLHLDRLVVDLPARSDKPEA